MSTPIHRPVDVRTRPRNPSLRAGGFIRHAAGAALLLALAAACERTGDQPAASRQSPGEARPRMLLTAQDREDLAYVTRLPRRTTAVELDLSDPVQHRHFLRMWELGGATPELYPELFRSFEETRQQHVARRARMNATQALNVSQELTPTSTATQPIVPVNYLSSFGPGETTGTYGVTALTSVPNTMQMAGTVTATTVGLYDANYNSLGSATTVQQYGNGALMRNQNTAPTPGSGDVIAAGTYYYKLQQGDSVVGYAGQLYARSSMTGGAGQYTMNNLAPVDVNRNGTIKVCIVRTDSDCDYRANSTNGQMVVQFPIQDTMIIPDTFQPVANQQASGSVNITITQPDAGSGGGCTLPASFNFWQGVQINGSKMSWNFNPGPFSNPNGSSVPCFPSNSNVVYDLQVTALGTSSTGATTYWFGEVKTTINPPPSPPPGSAYLVPMVVAYGCVADGSRITMADGSTKAIQEVRVGDRVLPARGARPLAVRGRTDGVERNDMVRVTVEGGESVLLTETHPVLTDRGPAMARDVRRGMTLRTARGEARVARVGRERFGGRVWNLELEGAAEGERTFIADGVVVGDSRMQQRLEVEARERAAAATRYVAPEWRVDARNYEAQQRRLRRAAGRR